MKKSIKFQVLSIKGILVGFFLLTTYYLLLTTNIYASHLPAEGWGCIENSIYYQYPEGFDEIFKDCQANEVCQNISTLDLISDAKCVDEQPLVIIDEEQPSAVLPDDAPQTSTGETSEEQAIYNLNRGLLPPQVISNQLTDEPNILKKILDAIGGLFSGLFWAAKIQDESKLYSQSDTIHQAEIPQKLAPETDDPAENLKKFLGGSTGFYGASIPKFGNSDIKSSECLFENASFPAGINPVTGREC